MAVSIFTSRIVLEYLGITDYGIYQSVGGIVGLVAFANTAISTGISRFITYGLGEENPEKLKQTFSTILTIQLGMALFLVIVAETVGLWFVTHKLFIPDEARSAAVFAYHISILTMILSMMSNPFNAAIIAHERMKVFAYISLFQAFASLGVAYALMLSPANKLQLYALLLFGVQLVVLSFYILYSRRHFDEINFKPSFHRSIFREVAGFTGWSLISSFSIALNNQGVLVLINMFFSPAVVAARSVSLTVNTAANNFVSNFRTAMNPQIVKQYAAGNFEGSKNLLLTSTSLSFFLMLMLCVPIFFTADKLLALWLKEVPEYAGIFLKLVILQSLFQIFDTSFYTALYAKGQLKQNALISPLVGFICLPVVYVLFKFGCSPVALSWAMLASSIILGMIVKPLLLIKIVDYTWQDIVPIFKRCLLVGAVTFLLGFCVYKALPSDNFGSFVLQVLTDVVLSAIIIYVIGLTSGMRKKLNAMLIKKLKLK